MLVTEAVGPARVTALHAQHETTSLTETEHAAEVADAAGFQLLIVDVQRVHGEAQGAIDVALAQLPASLARVEGLPSTQKIAAVYTLAREIARRTGGRVCGTLDLSECLLGYYPKDMLGGDLLPLGGLLRTEIRALAKELEVADSIPRDLPVVPGCGSIVGFTNKYANTDFSSEAVMDAELQRMLASDSGVKGSAPQQNLWRLCDGSRHKAAVTLLGRPVFYGGADTRRQVEVEAWAAAAARGGWQLET